VKEERFETRNDGVVCHEIGRCLVLRMKQAQGRTC
jgi:hypothetical protein